MTGRARRGLGFPSVPVRTMCEPLSLASLAPIWNRDEAAARAAIARWLARVSWRGKPYALPMLSATGRVKFVKKNSLSSRPFGAETWRNRPFHHSTLGFTGALRNDPQPGWYSPPMSTTTRNAPAHRPIRVAHVVDLLALAGMEYGVVKLVNRLDPDRFQSMIVCMRHQAEDVRPLLSKRVPVFELHKSPGRNWRVIGRLAARFRSERADIVHSHNWSTFLYSVAAARLAGVRTVVHGEHGKDDTTTDPRRVLASRFLARGVSRVCAVSRDLAESVIRDWRIPRERVAWIPNGVDLDEFGKDHPLDGLREELDLTPENRVVMNTGGFRTIKDHPTLLRA